MHWQGFSLAHVHYWDFTVNHTVWHSLLWGGKGGVQFASIVSFRNLKKQVFMKGTAHSRPKKPRSFWSVDAYQKKRSLWGREWELRSTNKTLYTNLTIP